MKSGLFQALCKEALLITTGRGLLLTIDARELVLRTLLQAKDARGLMLCFLVRARKALSVEGVQDAFARELFDTLDAIEVFARYDDVERLLALAPTLCHADRWRLDELALELMGEREAWQLCAIMIHGQRMLKAAVSRDGCWEFVHDDARDRVLWVARFMSPNSSMLPYLDAECAGMSVREREEILQELLYRRNALSRFERTIRL